jgi:hypothetical protein
VRVLALVLAFLLALGVALVFLVPGIRHQRPQRVQPAAESLSGERGPAPSPEPLDQAAAPAREPVPAGPTVAELLARVRALEAEVQELRARRRACASSSS